MSLWTDRNYPILQAFAEVEAAGKDRVGSDSIANTVGRDARDTWVGLQSLREAGYIAWSSQANPLGGVRVLVGPRVLERGRRELQQWPADGYAAFVAILEARIEAATDPEERSSLERLKSAVGGISRDVVTDLISAVLRDVTGLR